MKISIRRLIASSLLWGTIPSASLAASTADVQILWHRVCSRWTQDAAVYMPHNKKAEAALKILIGPDARLFAPEAPVPFAMQMALHEAVKTQDVISIDIPSTQMKDRVIYPFVHQDKSVLSVDSEKLARLQEKYKDLAVYVVNANGSILGSSSYIPRGIRYDEKEIGLVSTAHYFQYQILKEDGGFLVTLGFQTRRGVRDLRPVDLELAQLCDQSVTPLLVNFSEKTPRFKPADKGVEFKIVPDKNLKVSWPVENQDVAWVVRDLNNNGLVDSGRELFGSETEIGKGTFAANGFAALAVLDQDKNNLLDTKELKDLKLWFDKNANGLTDAGELVTLTERLSEMSLSTRLSSTKDEQGNKAPLISEAKDKIGRKILVLDYLLKTLDSKRDSSR